MKRALSMLTVCVFLSWISPGLAGASTLSWSIGLETSRVHFRDAGPGRVAVSVDGFSTLECLDYPALPYRVVNILLPQGEDVSSCRLEIDETQTLHPPARLAPFTGVHFDDGSVGGLAAVPSGAGAGPVPPGRVRYLGSNLFRGYRVASFAVYPVTCDVATGDLVVVPRARLVVETAPAPAGAETAERKRYVKGFREESRALVSRMVVNPEAASAYSFNETKVEPLTKAFLPSYEPSMEGADVAYLIVTNEAMAPAFQRLADWRTKKGVPAVVRTVEWIQQNSRWGADAAESVRNFIRDAYAQWGVEWVVLGGDASVIPARFGHALFGSDPFVPTDMYYSCLDGTWNADGDSLWGEAYHSVSDPGDNADLYAEVYIGRMPASNLAEANLLVDKTINYETPLDTKSKKKFYMLAEVIFPTDWTPGEAVGLDGAEVTEEVYSSYLQGKPDAVTSRLYQNYTDYPGSVGLTRDRAIDSLDTGVNHVLHVGHGFSFNMSVGDGSILNYDADHLTNGAGIFSLYLMSCSNVAFDTKCLAEAFLLSKTGGAFAVTGASRSAYPSASRPYLDTYYNLLFEHGVVQLGKLFTESRLPYTAAAEAESADRWTHFIYNYLGDPEASMFRGSVKSFVVSKPASAHFGANDITISVTSDGAPYDSAYVCLYKEGDDYAHAATGPSGTVVFEDFLCKSPGSITVTVTGIDHGRYSGTIPVTQATAAYLRVSGTTIDDTVVGNGDGVLDAGETVNLRIKLKNTGQTTATKLYAKIRSADTEVSVSDSTAIFANIPAGSEGWGSDACRFGVDASIADQHAIEFTIDMHDSTGGFWSEKFALDVHAPKLELYVDTAKDTLPYGNNNGSIENGESFLLKIGVKNFGTGAAYGLVGTIRSLDPDITVTDSVSTYNAVPLLGTSYGDGFVLSESNIGDPNYYRFVLTDAYGRTLTKRMELKRPGTPTGILLNTTFGPSEIYLTWHGPDHLESYRYQIYHSLTPGGPYTLASADLVSYTLYQDRSLAPSTRYYYVVTAVDSCGNEGPRSVEKTATTSPGQLEGWPNKVGKETASSVKIGDVDGDTHPDVVVGSDLIYAWHADGTELRDGDHQPLTWGVFSDQGDSYTATVALANLDGVPGLEIVGASWGTKQIYIFNKNGDVLPGWPKTTQNLCWASPVV
ncbi:MAG: C25 family cysteine peptidase, partial [Candidatus Krumholzibacteriaceae bacterium]